MNVVPLLQAKLVQALTNVVDDVAPYVGMLKATQDPRHGDYQINCAMPLGKRLGRKPADVALQICQNLDLGELLESPVVSGQGFINLRLRDDWLAQQVRSMGTDDRFGIAQAHPPKTFVIDYSSPNVAKPMHVGHLRSTIIGDALARLLRFLGHKVIADNHLGDWGTQFGILLYGYKHHLNKEAFEADPVRELARLYLVVRGLFKKKDDDELEDIADPVAEACRQETAKLHAGDPENRRLWELFMPHCYEEIDRIYRRLDIHFDATHGESFYQPMLADVVGDLVAHGIARETKGAIGIFFDGEEAPALVRKRDGAFTYTTSDLATIRYRMTHHHPDAMLYVVDFRQALHFRHLFDAARRWGYTQPILEHVQFGSVLGANRKPLKTREGGVPELNDLLDQAVERAEKVYRDNVAERGDDAGAPTAEELREIYEAVGLGAVKYADLCQNRTTDYVFDLDKMVSMDGNTATYLQYAYSRNRSILRRAGIDGEKVRHDPPLPSLVEMEERALALQLLRFEEALLLAAADYRPSAITGYLWELSKTFSGFFQNCPVLKADNPELRRSRLLLCDLTARVLQRGLNLLGIRTVERM